MDSAIEYRTVIQKNHNTKTATPYYVTGTQRKQLIQQLGDVCYIVFLVYVEKSQIDGFDYSDEKVAKLLGYSERKIQRARQTLIKYGWFARSIYTNSKGRKVIMTYLGQAAVHTFRSSKKNIEIAIIDV